VSTTAAYAYDRDTAVQPVDDDSFPELTLLDQVEYRMPEVPGWLRGDPGGRPSMELWMGCYERRSVPSRDRILRSPMKQAGPSATSGLG
jgi:hypothetical protein